MAPRPLALCLLLAAPLAAQQLPLHRGWAIQSSAQVTASGAALSTPGFPTPGWIPAAVPSTVFNALVENHRVPDPDVGMNLRLAPGVSYPIGANYSHLPIPPSSPYAVPWWFRSQFTLPPSFRGKTLWLDFHGINYRADIWLDGHQIASQKQVRGTFRRFEFNVTGLAHPGANVLAVEVFAPRIHDLALTFVDWNPMPPDKDMGLWQQVFLRASGPVALRHSWVQTRLDLPSLALAHLTVSTTLVNATDAPQSGTLRARLLSRTLAQSVSLAPHQTRTVSFHLDVPHPRLWWPHDLGAPTLQHLSLRFLIGGRVSDDAEQDFGMDQITAAKNANGAEQFYVNGRKLFVRGGGWTPDMLLRDGPARWALDFRYARALNLNTVRLEGKLMDDAFFHLADRYGILVMAGWCCCDHWEEWGSWTGDERTVATASLRDQATRLRAHPSLLVWLNGSDNPPPAPIERAYLAVLAQAHWPKPILSSASAKPTSVTGASGVKMTGPYDYVPPVYWLAEPQLGGARGFNTETSPGAAIPPIESLRRFIPPDHLWTGTGPGPSSGKGPDDPYWNFHAGSGQFLNLHRYQAALAARYGAPTSLRDYVWKSQASSYEGERAMFEAFGRRQGEATGVIQWMLNNGWPSLIWHLYDYYLRPGAGFYGVKLANQPLHVQYSDFDRAVSIVNHTLAPASRLVVTAALYSPSGHLLSTRRKTSLAADPQSSTDAFHLAPLAANAFLQLTLANPAGRQLSSNFYWLSARPDVLDLQKATWFYAPETSTADFRFLSQLPPVHLRSHAVFAPGAARVTVSNPSSHIAFMIRLRITQGPGGHEVLPVWWDDNYFSLLPGQSRTLAVHFRPQDLHGAAPDLAVDGFNVP